MNILLFGATGMVGDGVLRWLIPAPGVNRVVAISRKALFVQHPKLARQREHDGGQRHHQHPQHDVGNGERGHGEPRNSCARGRTCPRSRSRLTYRKAAVAMPAATVIPSVASIGR